ncbi:MAG: transporter substrate-binding domain-containing protein [Holosporales bacterium]|jgi:ABC-type amino acid transport substrate-binding protein|nr:transporter substrate-binding domain-containing protein [Holosporales bacterium]
MKFLKNFIKMLCFALCVAIFLCVLNRYSDSIGGVFDKIVDFFSGQKRQMVSKKIAPKQSSPEQYLDDDLVSYITEESEEEEDENTTESIEYGTIEGILERGELVILAKKDDQNHLFQMKTSDGRYIGKDVDFSKQLAATLGVRLVYKMIYENYDDIVEAIERGEGDIGIAKMSYTPERSRKVLFSTPYVNSRKTLLVNRIALEKERGETLKVLLSNNESSIGVTEGTSYENFVRKIFPGATIVSKRNWEEDIIKPLEEGKLTATMRDEVRVKLLLKTQPALLVKLMPIILDCEPDSLAVVVNFRNVGLLCWINKLIEAEEVLESVDDLLSKYGEDIK